MLSHYQQPGMFSKECRVDPEVQLQEARMRKEKYERAADALRLVTNMPFHIGDKSEGALLEIIGTVTIAMWREENIIEQLLAEIDKG